MRLRSEGMRFRSPPPLTTIPFAQKDLAISRGDHGRCYETKTSLFSGTYSSDEREKTYRGTNQDFSYEALPMTFGQLWRLLSRKTPLTDRPRTSSSKCARSCATQMLNDMWVQLTALAGKVEATGDSLTLMTVGQPSSTWTISMAIQSQWV